MVFLSTPAEANASLEASTMRSSAPLSKRSPNWVHPMPTMATRSLMPLLAIAAPQYRSGLPEVVVDAVGGEQTAERHLHSSADRQVVDLGVGELDGHPTATVEVDHREHDRRAGRVCDAGDGEGDDGALHVGHRHSLGGILQRRQLVVAPVRAF